MSQIRQKVFILYHHVDQTEVENFVRTFDEEHNVLIALSVDKYVNALKIREVKSCL